MKKKWLIVLITLSSAFSVQAKEVNVSDSSLSAEETTEPSQANPTDDHSLSEETTTADPNQPKTVGKAASDSSRAGKNSNWQNWAFAGGSILVAAVGLIVIAVNNGTSSASHQ